MRDESSPVSGDQIVEELLGRRGTMEQLKKGRVDVMKEMMSCGS